ncbi:MAG: diguanylate cyclase, partial [Burkholderiales bacterium]|nr:diguanylate cyclase [Burkholderiales bacterium]
KLLVVLEYMENNGLHHVGVVDGCGDLVGIATHSDILTSIDPVIFLERKTIGEMVARQQPVMFTGDWILADVMHHFRDTEDAIIVVDEGRPVGIVTTKDVFGLIFSGADVCKPLSALMSSPVITAHKGTTINESLLQLKYHHIKRTIIVDDDQQLVGVIPQSELISYAYGSWMNILKDHSSELQELVDMLEVKARRLELLAVTDVLTGLGNRRLLNRKMDEEVERIGRYGASGFSLVMVDIDHFKLINDAHGHMVGDLILKAVAMQIEQAIRKTDIAVRWGGEEFMMLLSHTTLDAAEVFADRLRLAIQQHVFVSDIRVSISLGVGEYVPGENEFELFQRIDRALYRAKLGGRNRVETDRSNHNVKPVVPFVPMTTREGGLTLQMK